MDMQTRSPLEQANDIPMIPAVAAECSDDALAEIVFQALRDRSEIERFDDNQKRIVCSDKVIAAVNNKVRRDKFAPVARERIIAVGECLKRQALQERNEQRLASFAESVGKRYADCTLDNYTVTCHAQEKALAALREYAANIVDHVDSGRGVVLFGPAGSGKDHLLVALGKEAIPAGLIVSWRNGRDLAGEFRDAARSDAFSERHLLEELEEPEILILSDPIPPAGGLTAFQADVMFRLVDARYRAMRPIWATLNVTGGDEADSRMGTQIVDRLKHDALAIFCDWPSHRKARSA